MISLGVATAIQIVSNLENTTKKQNSVLMQLFETTPDDEDDESDEDNSGSGEKGGRTSSGSNPGSVSSPAAESSQAPASTPPTLRPTAGGRGMPGRGRMGERGLSGRFGGRGAPQQVSGPLVLPPAVMAQFDGILPSEKLTINCIMQV